MTAWISVRIPEIPGRMLFEFAGINRQHRDRRFFEDIFSDAAENGILQSLRPWLPITTRSMSSASVVFNMAGGAESPERNSFRSELLHCIEFR
jgi:hypothetical protein